MNRSWGHEGGFVRVVQQSRIQVMSCRKYSNGDKRERSREMGVEGPGPMAPLHAKRSEDGQEKLKQKIGKPPRCRGADMTVRRKAVERMAGSRKSP